MANTFFSWNKIAQIFKKTYRVEKIMEYILHTWNQSHEMYNSNFKFLFCLCRQQIV